MAVLYRAVQETLGRPVAIKALKTAVQEDEAFAQRFEREARTLAQLQHENLIHVYEFYREQGALFIVMELVDGVDLYDLLEKVPRLPSTVAACIALQVARALSYLHTMGVLHRDLKPANVLLSKSGIVKLGDFGIADDPRYAGDLTATGATLGTPSYMSPEQILGERLDWRSDQFSLGIVLYQMLAGRKPFAEDALHSLPEKIRTQAPQELAKSCPETPSALIRIVERCLRKKRDQRYRTPEQLLVALEGFVGDHVGESGQAHIVRFLVERGLLPATDLSGLPQPQAHKRRVRLHLPTQLRVPLVHAGLLLLLLFGVSLLRALPLGMPRSPLAPPGEPPWRSSQLLVIADPWAEVFVDGQRIETTPFSSPLRLRSGRRYLELRGPYFKAVRQMLDLVPGELRVVKVQMPLLTRGS